MTITHTEFAGSLLLAFGLLMAAYDTGVQSGLGLGIGNSFGLTSPYVAFSSSSEGSSGTLW